jgi:uncharacterized protein (DUF2267 family)
MNKDRFLSEVMHRAGIESRDKAWDAVEATLEVLGQRLLDIDTRLVADQLPSPLNTALRRHQYESDFEVDEFYHRVATRQGVEVRHAVEHSQVVCQVLSETVNREGRIHLRVHLPDEMAQLFQRRRTTRELAPITPRQEAERRNTLSTGRVGSRRPIAEASPSRAHSQSVAATDHPHAETKLSTAKGVSAERKGETLASGKAKRHHP